MAEPQAQSAAPRTKAGRWGAWPTSASGAVAGAVAAATISTRSVGGIDLGVVAAWAAFGAVLAVLLWVARPDDGTTDRTLVRALAGLAGGGMVCAADAAGGLALANCDPWAGTCDHPGVGRWALLATVAAIVAVAVWARWRR